MRKLADLSSNVPRILTRRNIAILTLGLIALLVSVGIEHPFFAGVKDNESVIFNIHSVASLLKELSFALIIALVIVIGIETESRQADNERAERMRAEIALDVFKGVFSNRLPKSYVDRVVQVNLQPSLIRETLQRVYVLETVSDNDLILQLTEKVTFNLRNVSIRHVKEKGYYTVPSVRPGSSVRARTGPNLDEMGPAKEIKADAGKAIISDYDVDLQPDEVMWVEIESVMIKYKSDSHTSATSFPTLNADISMSSTVPKLVIGFQSNSSAEFKTIYESKEGSIARWQSAGPMLTNDSTIIFWNA